MRRAFKIVGLFLVFGWGFVARLSWADSFPAIQIAPSDRVLVIAPHPDDETIGTGGVIQKALELKIPLKVVYLTNGDSNEVAFFVYKHRPVLSRKELLQMGELRRSEAIAAMHFLGVRDDQMVFLGYPDFGTMPIFTGYWNSRKPFKSFLSRVSHVPYRETLSPGAPYDGESIRADLEGILAEFQPTKIFVTHPVDTNADHRAAALFVDVALWDLDGRIPAPAVYQYLIHALHYPPERGYHPHTPLQPLGKLLSSPIRWQEFRLTPAQTEKKKEAIALYKSQIKDNPPYLVSFARPNELFGDYPAIALRDGPAAIDWDALEAAQNTRGHGVGKRKRGAKRIESITYARRDGKLYIRIKSPTWTNKLLGINLFLIGYRHDVDFADMPKLKINIRLGKIFTIYEKKRPVFVWGVRLSHRGGDLTLEMPLSVLENPQRLLSCGRAYLFDLPVEVTAWRVLEME